MTEPDFQNLPTSLGVYTLTELLGRGELTDMYLARQSHVERGVVVQVLRPGHDRAAADYFLDVVRARGSATLPGMSRVLESKMAGKIWFLAHECPVGVNLEQMARDGVRLSTAQACAVIATVAQMYAAAEQQNIAMEPLTAHSIFVKGDDDVRILSPVLCGESDPTAIGGHMQALAAILEPVLPQNVPGQGRVATLVQWIAQGYEGRYLEWSFIESSATEIKQQTAPLLTRSAVENLNTTGAVVKKVRQKAEQRRLRRRTIGVAAAALVVVLIGAAGALLAPGEGEILPARTGRYLYVQAEHGPRRVMLRPVSILEYRKFLAAYEDPEVTDLFRRAAINEGIPESHTGHTPVEWQQQLQAVDSGQPWHGEILTDRSPVRGVSYWDALAYANYSGGELPTAAVLATAREHAEVDTALPEEWTTTRRPADTLYTEGQLLFPPTGREWFAAEPDLAARDVSRGFRIVLPIPKKSD